MSRTADGLCRNGAKRMAWHFFERMITLFTGTTIVCVRDGARVAMAGDGQVTLGSQIIKSGARKVRPLLGERY